MCNGVCGAFSVLIALDQTLRVLVDRIITGAGFFIITAKCFNGNIELIGKTGSAVWPAYEKSCTAFFCKDRAAFLQILSRDAQPLRKKHSGTQYLIRRGGDRMCSVSW